jgi:hypothetical protein
LVQASGYCTSAWSLKVYCPGPGGFGQIGGQNEQQSAALRITELTGLLAASPTVIAAVSSTPQIITMRAIFI